MDIRQIDLNLLPVFDALMTTRSVTRAAQNLGLSQSAMSAALGRLRVAFDDPLFVRGARQMLPTPRARRLVEPVREVIERIRRDVLADSGFEPALVEREFSLGLTDLGGILFLPRLLAALGQHAPRVTLRTDQLPASELEAALEQGAVDVAIGNYPDLPGSVYQQRLYERSYVCVVRSDHPRVGTRLNLKQYLALEHAVVRSPVRIHATVDKALARSGLQRRVVVSVPHYLVIPHVIEKSDLAATVPREAAEVFGRYAKIRAIELPVRIPGVTLRQHWHRRYHHDAANRWLRGVISELFAE